LGGKPFDDGAANATGATGDDDDFVFEGAIHNEGWLVPTVLGVSSMPDISARQTPARS
jgi:hypothetical protein